MSNVLKTKLYNKFYYDYLSGNKEIQKFLPAFKNVNWQETTKSILENNNIYRQVKEQIIRQNSDISSERDLEKLSELKNENSVFIITGQQLGLLASPLYTIYKMITAVNLADYLNSQNLGFNYLPLFWLESEDHDFQEINHFGIWDKNFNPIKLTYQGHDRGKTSIKHYTFDEQINPFIENLRNELIPTEFTDSLFSKLRKIFKTKKLWLNATHEFLKDIFSETGFLFFKPGDPEIKKLSVPFFTKIIENSLELNTQFKNISDELKKQGYPNQVTVYEGKSFLFFEDDELQREHMFFTENHYYTSDTIQKFEKDKLLQVIKNNPEKISTNVVSRPLLQSWLLPTAAYVAGPGEIAYWAQIGGMFEQVKLTMPVVYPRVSATLLEPKIQRFVNKYDFDIENMPKKQEEFIAKVLSSEDDTTFKNVRVNFAKELETIKQKMISVDPTLENVFSKTSDKILGQADFLEQKTLKAIEQKNQIMVSQLQQIHSAFFPENSPQERYLTFVYFLNKYGSDIIKKLLASLKQDDFRHQIIEI